MASKASGQDRENVLNIFGQPLTIFGVPVDREIIFNDHKGVYKQRVEKRQRRLIAKTTFITFFLRHKERIQCLTTAYSPTGVLEQLFTGPAFLLFKRAILIFTDQRMLHVPTRFDRSSHGAISQVNYEDCATIQLKGRSLLVGYKNGKEETFLYIGRREKKKLKAFIQTLPLKPKEAGRLQGRVYLCPSCTNQLLKAIKHCPSCHLKFKTKLKAIIRTVLIPGGGYSYSGHAVVGMIAGLFEIALISSLIYNYLSYRQGLSVGVAIPALWACGLIFEKFIAAFHACRLVRYYLPATKNYAKRKV